MHKPLDHTFVFSMIGLMPVVLIWLLKRDWLHDSSINHRIKTACIVIAAIGIIGFCVSPRHLEFVFFLLPVYQLSLYNMMLRIFQRRYHRDPFWPPRLSMSPAHVPDFTFNTIFGLLTVVAMMPVLGIIFARLQSRI
jgi:hypothetical protein